MNGKKIFSKKVIIILSLTMVACCVCLLFALAGGKKLKADCVKRIAPNADLTGCGMYGEDLHGKDFHGANLTNANLSGSNLTNANLQGAKLDNTNLEDADLTGALLDGATWKTVNLSNVKGLDDGALSRLLNVPIDQVSATLSKELIRLEARDNIVLPLGGQYSKGVCDGIAFPETAEYSANDRFHPIVLIDINGTYHGSYENPTTIEQWEPMAMRYASLAGCIGFQEQEVAFTCHYEGNLDVNAEVNYLNIKVFATRTGQLVSTIKVTGETPSCPNKYVQGAGATGGISGPKVSMDEIKKALAPFVNPP